jgi:peptide/nickel transport system substrate-binding protein
MRLRKDRVLGVIFVISIVIGIAVFITNKNKKPKNQNTDYNIETVYENSIRLGISNFDTINPILTNNKLMININQLIYEPLFELSNNYKLNNCLAKEIAKTSPTTYVLKVDTSVKWSDGSNFTAKDVKYTVDIIKSRNNIFYENVKHITNVDVIDDSTAKITLDTEVPFFEYNLIFPIMCKQYYSNEDFFSSSKNPIGTGKYKIEAVNSNQIILVKNPEYRNKDLENEKLEIIVLNIYNEIGEVYNGFKLGNIDILSVSSSQYKNYIGTLGYYAKEYIGREYDFLSMNCNDNFMKYKAVRQAINCAIDKDNIVSNVYNNEYYKANYPLDFGSFLYNNSGAQTSYNIEKAKEYLINDGWIYSNNVWRKQGVQLRLTLTVNSSNKKRVETANLIKQQLDSFGIATNIRELSDNEYYSCLQEKRYQIILTGVYGGYSPDLEMFYGEGNMANYSNSTVINILKEVRNITDEKLLKEKYNELISITLDDSAYIGLYRNRCSLIISRKMTGNYEPNNYGIFTNFNTWSRER